MLKCVYNLMNYAALIFCIREGYCNAIWGRSTLKVVCMLYVVLAVIAGLVLLI